ncbi:MAG: hypothetical protein LUG18_13675 [Candidatus Azobacteroides sp.]|nr:hypothetical protein [Candidatus Azobacteroides sp.]
MAIPYSIMKRENFIKPEEPARFYACHQIRKSISTNKFLDDIAWGTALTKSEVYGVIVSLVRELKKHMLAGNCVDLVDFGKFSYHIHSAGAISEEAFTTDFIRKVKVHFVPDAEFVPDVKKVEFERVLPVKIKKEMLRRNKE